MMYKIFYKQFFFVKQHIVMKTNENIKESSLIGLVG